MRLSLLLIFLLSSQLSVGHVALLEKKYWIWSDSKGLIEMTCQPSLLTQGFDDEREHILEMRSRELVISFHGLNLPLENSFWQLVQETAGISAIKCEKPGGNEIYALFDVSVPEVLNPVIRVGVSEKETNLFRHRILHSISKAEQLIVTRSQTRTNRLLEQKQKTIQANSGLVTPTSLVDGLDVQNGSLQYVACVTGAPLQVRNDNLNNILFTVIRSEEIKLVQTFGVDRKNAIVEGQSISLLRIQFLHRPSGRNRGWLPEKNVQLRAQCGSQKINQPIVGQTNRWSFPTLQRPTESYKEGMKRFRAGREGGRLHAACDLYRNQGEPTVAINSGTVIRDRYYFYQGTYALEVKHIDGRIARYGEITGKQAPGISQGAVVTSGQALGYVGKINSDCCSPMLHFEMYSGSGSGALSQSGNDFQRRSDLMDPTEDLATWEQKMFGVSY